MQRVLVVQHLSSAMLPAKYQTMLLLPLAVMIMLVCQSLAVSSNILSNPRLLQVTTDPSRATIIVSRTVTPPAQPATTPATTSTTTPSGAAASNATTTTTNPAEPTTTQPMKMTGTIELAFAGIRELDSNFSEVV